MYAVLDKQYATGEKMHKTIMVTGGLGLIGHNVVAKLEKQGIEVVVVDNETNYGVLDTSEIKYLIEERKKKIQTKLIYNMDIGSKDIESLFKYHNIDAVIHCASLPRQKVVNANPCLGARTMIEGLLNLCELSKNNGVKRFVYISSSMVYGPFDNDVREDAVCSPEGQYGIMKLSGEWLVRDYFRKGAFNYTIIRPSAVYGPLDVEDRVISKFILSAMRGTILKVNGANETLDFTYVDDAADGIVAAVLSPNAINRTYNITKSHSVTLLSAAERIIRLVGSGQIECKGRDLDFPSRGSLNIDAARQDFGYDPKVDVDEGFVAYYNWLTNSEYWVNRLNTQTS
jgi:UDP-glucose 4-epimerase